MTGSPLGYVNGYLVEDEDGYTLIDCGWKADDVFEALQAGLSTAGVKLSQIRRLAVTHFHYDHYGLAGTLMRAGVPALLMHSKDWIVADTIFADPAAAERGADAWIARNGYDYEGDGDADYHRMNERAVPTHFVRDGERVGRLRAIWTPGHSPGHLCFFDHVSNKLFTGDHILDPITPHVGIWRQMLGDPMGDYVDSLEKCATITTSGALPAHGEPFSDLPRRLRELLAHQSQRQAQVQRRLADGTVMAADVARELGWTRRDRAFEELSTTHQQFAVAETLAFLQHLRARGGVVQRLVDDRIYYERTNLVE